MPQNSSDVQLGMGALFTRSHGIGHGIVRYIGKLPGRKDNYFGIELRPGQGKSPCLTNF